MSDRFDALLRHAWLELTVRWLLGAVFIAASVHKIADPAQFAKIIYGYGLAPHSTINLMAIVLPYLELFTGGALAVGVYPRSAALILNLMLLVFAGAISINLVRGHVFDCGCFGTGMGHRLSAGALLVRDLLFLVLGAGLMAYRGRRRLCMWDR